MGFPGGSVAKNPPANAGDMVSVPGSGRSPEGGIATHSSFLAWEIPGQRSLVGYSPWSHKRVGHSLVHKQQKCQSLRTAALCDIRQSRSLQSGDGIIELIHITKNGENTDAFSPIFFVRCYLLSSSSSLSGVLETSRRSSLMSSLR